MPDLTLALLITVTGMGLVFGAILLIWLLIFLMVRFTQERATADAITADNRKQRAAAIAVAAAIRLQLQEQEETPHIPPPPPTAIISAWQAVMRQSQLRNRGPR